MKPTTGPDFPFVVLNDEVKMTLKHFYLRDALKGFTLDQDKIVPPDETVRNVKTKMNQVGLNLLEKTLRIDNGRLGIPVYFSLCGYDAAAVTGTRKQMGKGATPEQAEASAVMELAERFSFFSFAKNPKNFYVLPRAALKEEAIPFSFITRSVHDPRDTPDIEKEIFDALPMKWTPAFNLTREAPCLVPFDWFYAINAFNGPSAGNCPEEAIIQGICEVVERHVSAEISRNALPVPILSSAGITDFKVIEMLDKYRRIGVKLTLSDFTLHMGIPSVGVLAMDPATFPEKSEIVWTAGTAPDPQKALSRALTEVAQLAGDFNTASNYVASGLPKPKHPEAVSFITRGAATVDITQLPNLSDANIKVEILRAVEALALKSMEVFLIDTTHPLLGIPAFYTIIPGARFRERTTGSSVGMFCAKHMTETLPPDKALQELHRMDQKLPGTHYIPFYMGSCRLALHQPEEALELFRLALGRAPMDEDRPGIYAFMGTCLKDMGRFPEAVRVLQEGIALDPDRTDLYNLSGFCYFQLKEHEKAIDQFRAVLKLDPTSAIDYANIGSNYREMKNTAKAIQYYEMALELDPSIEFARTNLKRLKNSV